MATLPHYGKITKNFLDRVIYSNLGASRSEVAMGPSRGIDTCAIRIGKGKVLVGTTDPLSLIPRLGESDSAWMSVNLIASDLVTSGFRPQYSLFELNLPPKMPLSSLEIYWKAISEECKRLGIAIVGGHTGKFEGLNYTIVGAGTMFSIGSEKRYLTSNGGMVGDKVILTKGAAISTTGILSKIFANKIRTQLGKSILRKAQSYFKQISVVREALIVAKLNPHGITAMHDAAEGGVLCALCEFASSSNLGLLADGELILISEETRAVCDLFGIDPYASLGEGALVISCNPNGVDKLLDALRRKRIRSSVVGEFVRPEFGVLLKHGKKKRRIRYPFEDPYWRAYYSAVRKKWN